MKLLIVEDETMTREGIMQSLDWQALGVSNVLCAENGETALSIAGRFMPDIVITDIRMPRMDGVTMAGRIRAMLPDCRIIFLSAYSNIDYYKAAIDLKAVQYLDKPIETDRLRAAVEQAAAECAEIRRHQSNSEFHKQHEKQKLANAICLEESAGVLESEAKRLGLSWVLKRSEHIVSLIVNLRLSYEEELNDSQMNLAAAVSQALSQQNLYTVRHKNRIVLFLFMPTELTAYAKNALCERIRGVLAGHAFYIAVGQPARGLGNANKSYQTAKAALEKAYCYPFGHAVFYDETVEACVSLSAYAEEKSDIAARLNEKDREGALAACQALYEKLKGRKDLTYQKARELYYEIISGVFRLADALRLQIKEDAPGEEVAWVVRIESFNLDELHGFACRQITLLLDALEATRNEKRQISAVKDYIAQHYAEDALSVSDISNCLHISASHMCTTFKKETGSTINNYLTEYRLEKAKRYLDETLVSVAEISAKVGYKDNSYFGRIFRKRYGMTPLEYRNR